MGLNASQLEGFLAEFRAEPGINELARKYMQTARWLEWLGASGLPEEVVRDRAYNLSAGWTERDYQAGKWLASAPPGRAPARGRGLFLCARSGFPP